MSGAHVILLLCVCVALPALGACGGDETRSDSLDQTSADQSPTELTPAPVPGAVLSVAGQPILRRDLEELADAAGIVTPEFSRPHHLRLALDIQLIPRAALVAAHLEERALAKTAALGALERLQSDPASGRELGSEIREDSVRDLGLDLWYTIHRGARGKWLGPVEHLGRWRLARWVAVQSGSHPGENLYTCELLDFWYLEGDELDPWLEEALAAAELQVHDKEIGALVTESMRWRMKQP